MIDESTRCYQHPDRMAATGCQRCDRPICTEDMRSASVGFHCPECVKEAGQRVITPASLQFQPIATMALIGINILAYLAQTSTGGTVTDNFVLWGPFVQLGEPYRLLTSGFLHGSLIHIGFNMYLLWMLGPALEKAFGVGKYLLLYFGSLFGGSAAVMLFNWDQSTLGASGAVMGLAGAMGAIYKARGFDVRQSPAFGLVVLNLALPLLIPGISFWGHLGGVVGGAVTALALVWLPERTSFPAKASVFAAAAVMVFFAVLGVYAGEIGCSDLPQLANGFSCG